MTRFEAKSAMGRGYQVHKPAGEGPFPTILFLHGRGESGADNLAQTQVGIGPAILPGSHWEKFLIIFPQKLDDSVMWTGYGQLLDEVLADVDLNYKRDTSRTYITGISQGGYGTWMLAGTLRWRFAAAAPICGWCDPTHVLNTLRTTPIWAFHGDADDIVNPASSISAIEWLKRAGCEPKLTLIAGAGHNSWDHAYKDEPLASWFLQQKLP